MEGDPVPTFRWDLVRVGAGLEAKEQPLARFPGSHCSWTGLAPTWGLSQTRGLLLAAPAPPATACVTAPLWASVFLRVAWLWGCHGPRALCQVGGPRLRCGRKLGCSVLLRACGS